MDQDERLAREVFSSRLPAALRVYGWNRPAISIGRAQSPASLRGFDLPVVPMVRRPTGGGAVLHRPDELTYAAAIPASAVNPLRLRQIPEKIHWFLRAHLIEEGRLKASYLEIVEKKSKGPFSFCFNAPVEGDLLFQGRKAAGSAMRVWKEGILIQGCIQSLPIDRELLIRCLELSVRKTFDVG